MSSLLFSFTLFETHHHYRRSKLSSHTKLLDANQRIKLQAHEIEKKHSLLNDEWMPLERTHGVMVKRDMKTNNCRKTKTR